LYDDGSGRPMEVVVADALRRSGVGGGTEKKKTSL
jgi:hypothetical protein